MARILDEKFEGAGYEESWSESVGAGCTINEDAVASDVSSPSGWDSQCLKVITAAATANYTITQFGDAAIRYTRFEVIFTDLSGLSSDGHYFIFFGGANNSLSTYTFLFYCYRTGGQNYFLFDPWYDGSAHTTSVATVSANTRYCIEVKWDKTNNLYECTINGSSVLSGSIQIGSVQHGALLIGSSDSGNKTWTGYFDLIAVDNAAWVGQEVTSLVVTDGVSVSAGDVFALVQEHLLVLTDGAISSVGEVSALLQEHNLVVFDGINNSVGEVLPLVQEHELLSTDGIVKAVSENVVLSEEITLSTVDGACASVSDSATLEQEQNLVATDGISISIADALDLVQEHNLSAVDGASVSAVDVFALSTTGEDVLYVLDGAVVAVADSFYLIQAHNLETLNASVSTVGETLDLVQAGLDLLTVSDGAVVSAADAFEVSQEQGLAVADGFGVNIVDALVLYQEHVLATSDCYNPNHVDDVGPEIEHWLEISDAAVRTAGDFARIYSLTLGPIIDPYILSVTAKMKLESVTPVWMVKSITTRRTIKQGEI